MNARSFLSSKVLRSLAGYAVAALCLLWVFHDTDWRLFVGNVANINWLWTGLGVISVSLSFAVHGVRWRLLLKPLGAIGVLRTTQAVYCGILVNDILPMSVGELTRAYLVSLWMKQDVIAIFPSVILERICEAIWLALGIGMTAFMVPVPDQLRRAVDIFGAVVLLLVGVVLLLALKRRGGAATGQTPRSPRGHVARWFASLAGRLGEGFRSIGFSPRLAAAFGITLLVFALQAASLWCFMNAYGLGLSFGAGAAVYFIILFGTALPVSPGGVGTYQFFCVVALTLFGLEKTRAAGFSLIAFVLMSVPLLAISLVALAKSGVTLSFLREKISNLRVKNRAGAHPVNESQGPGDS